VHSVPDTIEELIPMGTLMNLLSRRRLAVTIGLLLLIALTWVVGWWLIGLSATISFVITLVILVLWILLLMMERVAAEKGANELEQSIKAQSEDHVMGLRPEKREEVELLRGQLTSAIESLKKSKLGKGRSGKAALYALPWYMIIGPPAAGKTTAIRNSGLEFPFGADREIQGVGGTRNCDWWFTSSAILLDTAGRYMTEEDDKEEWQAFLDILKKHRRRQPINGVIIAMSIADLLNATPDEVDAHAKNVRKRIDELIQRLGVRFPVYLVFTKCDLLNGFVEFYEDLSRVQRHQVWGCTFSKEQVQKDNPRASFEEEFMLLYQTLVQLRLARLGPGMKRENRRLVFAFPLQVLAAKNNLSQFVGKVFQPNPYQETPIFRGFYLTSGTQEGVPIDRVIQSIASGFGLPPEVTEQFNPEIKPKAYFIKDLFTDIIIPDERLVRLTSRAERSKRAARIGSLAASVVLLALFILGVTWGYRTSRANLDETAREVQSLKGTGDTAHTVQTANLLLARIQKLSDPPRAFGMDRSGTVLDQVRTLFFKEMQPFIRRNILAALESRLRQAASQRGSVYDDLKTYLLLTSDIERLREEEEYQTFVTAKMASLLSPQLAVAMRDGLQYYAGNFAKSVEDSLTGTFPGDKAAIATARAVAGRPNVANLYERLRSRTMDLQAVSLPDDRALRAAYTVPGVFTKPGAEAMAKLIETELTDPGAEAEWVLGVRDQKVMTTENERAKMAAAIKELYFRDYAANWWKLIGALQVEPFSDLASAAERMKRLGDPNESPVLRFCKQIVDQTRFDTGLLQDLKEKAEGKGVNLGSRHPVDLQFEGFHQFVEGVPEQKTASDLSVLMNDAGKVGDALEALRDAPPKNTKSYTAKIVRGESSELSDALRDTRQVLKMREPSTRETMKNIFERTLLQVWRTLLSTTQAYLNQAWRTGVYDSYQQLLAGAYPFDPRSTRDASIGDISQFFSGSGNLGTFLELELKPFLAEGDAWDAREWERMGIEISPAAREGLRNAQFITKSYFRGNDVGMSFQVTVEPPVPPSDASDFDRVCLLIGDQETDLHWKKERSVTAKFDWPGSQVGRGASIRIINERFLLGESLIDSISVNGDWGLFRLLSRADKSQGAGRAEYRYHWSLSSGIDVYCLFKAETSAYNPFSRALTVRFPDRLN
jgi:type VI secretion system protein ImpL